MTNFAISLTLILIFLGFIGCTTAKPIVGPDGTENQLISCSTIEYCYDKAREVCKGTYKIINTSSETSGANGFSSTDLNLLVKCDNK